MFYDDRLKNPYPYNPAAGKRLLLDHGCRGDWLGWLYIPDFEPSGGSLFAPGADFNLGGCTSSEMDHLSALMHEAGTPQQVQQRFFAYERLAAVPLPMLYQPMPDILTAVVNQVKGYARRPSDRVVHPEELPASLIRPRSDAQA